MAKQERNPQRGGNGTSQPITRHPLFPVIVALWFGALFGLASVLLSPATIERAVAATGLAKVIPMAAPPLGTTARLLVALGLTGIGGVIGALIGLRLSSRGTSGAEAMHDLSGEAFDAVARETPVVGRLPGRRRGFIAPPENTDETGYEAIAAPAPAPGIFQLADLDENFDPRAFAAPASEIITAHSEPVNEVTDGNDHLAEANIHGDAAKVSPIETPVVEADLPPHSHLADAFSPSAWADPIHAHDSDEEESEVDRPVGRLFEAYARAIEAPESPAATLAGNPSTHGYCREEYAADAPVTDVPSHSPGAERIAAAPLDDLSHVELLERLALAMEEQRRKLALAQATPLSIIPFPLEDTPAIARVADNDPAAGTVRSALQEAAGDDDTDEGPAPTQSVAPVLQRLSSLGVSAPFAPPPFAPPPYGTRQSYAAATEADDAPVQSVEDFASHAAPDAHDPLAIGGWSDSDAADETGAEGEFSAIASADEVEIQDNEPYYEPAPIAPVPAALRPVGTTDFDDGDAVPGYIPPRHIAMPAAPGTSGETPCDASDRPMAGLAGGHDFASDSDEQDDEDTFASADGEEEFADDGADAIEEGVLEEGYSSLLSLQRRAEPHHNLISIEGETVEEDTAGAAEDLRGEAPAVADEPAPAFTPPSLPGARLFDPPGRPDPAETEKALRAALATLQRMSGAA